MVYTWPLCFYQRIPTLQREAPTAPVFRSRPEIEDGFLHGGFWKYNAKPSNILPFTPDYLDNDESGHTIQDDVVVAGQDIAAGLIRMGILQRIQYLLEVCFIYGPMFLFYSSLWLWEQLVQYINMTQKWWLRVVYCSMTCYLFFPPVWTFSSFGRMPDFYINCDS